MAFTCSPYAAFKASDWSCAVASPIGIGQCIRLKTKAYSYKKLGVHKKIVRTSKKVLSKDHVQLSFA